MHVIIVGHPVGDLVDDSAGVRPWTDASVIAFYGAHEGFSHAVALGALDWGGSWYQADASGKGPRFPGGVATTIIGQPLDVMGQTVHLPEAIFDGGDHEIPDILGGDAASRRDKAHGFTITAVEREGDAHLLAIVAAYFEAVGTPTGIAYSDRNLAIMPALFPAPAMSREQKAMKLHDAVDALLIGRCAPVHFGLAA